MIMVFLVAARVLINSWGHSGLGAPPVCSAFCSGVPPYQCAAVSSREMASVRSANALEGSQGFRAEAPLQKTDRLAPITNDSR